MCYFKLGIGAKKVYYFLAFLVAGRWRLLFASFCQFLFQAAFTIAVHHGLIPVLAKVSRYIVFIGVILRYYHNLAEGLQQYAH